MIRFGIVRPLANSTTLLMKNYFRYRSIPRKKSLCYHDMLMLLLKLTDGSWMSMLQRSIVRNIKL